MGLCISGPDRGPVPRRSVLTLSCDVHPGGFFSSPVSTTFSRGHFAEQYGDAMRAGWKETFAHGQRLFACPECSGKK